MSFGKIALGIVLVGAGLAGAVALGLFETSVVSKSVETPLDPAQLEKLVPAGANVAKAADCTACHTAPGGAPLAGGLGIETPFGVIYATNITPDTETGIGSWTRADFHRAVRDGKAPGGRRLYPAMPYASFRHMSEADVDALYAYFKTRLPMKVANRADNLEFPFNIRTVLAFWNLVNLPSTGVVAPEPQRSDLWNRGRYVVNALAHCGECHTPRNITQGMKSDAALQGTLLGGVEAPAITKAGLTQMGFDPVTLASFMKSGLSAQGGMTGSMFEVVHYSTQYMSEEDLSALSAYLFDLDVLPESASPPAAPPAVEIPADATASAQTSFTNLCAGCHGATGIGIPNVSVPLTTNASVRLTSGRNLIKVIVDGLPEQNFPGLAHMQAMPGFRDRLSDQQIADLANWLRARWGGQQPNVTAQAVTDMR